MGLLTIEGKPLNYNESIKIISLLKRIGIQQFFKLLKKF